MGRMGHRSRGRRHGHLGRGRGIHRRHLHHHHIRHRFGGGRRRLGRRRRVGGSRFGARRRFGRSRFGPGGGWQIARFGAEPFTSILMVSSDRGKRRGDAAVSPQKWVRTCGGGDFSSANLFFQLWRRSHSYTAPAIAAAAEDSYLLWRSQMPPDGPNFVAVNLGPAESGPGRCRQAAPAG